MKDPKRIVQQGYDRLGHRYRTHYEQENPHRYEDLLRTFIQVLSPNADVLELGCADGIPTAQYLSQYVNYQGVDISPIQINLARRNAPSAHFEVADMAALVFPDRSFDGIIALYSIIHLPLAEQPALFKSAYQWLRPNGYLLCIVGAGEWTGTDSNWIEPGTGMYWSHTDADTYQTWFTHIGFAILDRYFVPEGDGGHTYFLLNK
ncbi:class I SAM-dependent methyltransferase [Spirosoma sp. KNUC1025]|uniref:class I SAM-dependent methyltransferase n=1 Tax=Spirosoma sp. KNUC1025 TaxID=2894082 RepID=UPI0038667869|nr:class I SAM-dependent methyltransferase [Spirosoma sp. KNUC1025]